MHIPSIWQLPQRWQRRAAMLLAYPLIMLFTSILFALDMVQTFLSVVTESVEDWVRHEVPEMWESYITAMHRTGARTWRK